MPIRRYVTCVKKSSDGDIIEIGNITDWGTIPKIQAIREIESQLFQYFVDWGEYTTEIKVVADGYFKYLRTDKDSTKRNNLEELKICS